MRSRQMCETWQVCRKWDWTSPGVTLGSLTKTDSSDSGNRSLYQHVAISQ